MSVVVNFDDVASAGIPGGRAGGNRAGSSAGGKFSAVGDVHRAIGACAFGQRAVANIGSAIDNLAVVHQQRAVQIQALVVEVDGTAGFGDRPDKGGAAAAENQRPCPD